MLMNFYKFSHETLGMCFYTLPSLIVGAVMAVTALVHGRNQKKREEEFEDSMEGRTGASSGADVQA